MSGDAEMLLGGAAPPDSWAQGGRTYLLARPAIEEELLFQTRHVAWARNQLEATRAFVGRDAYTQDVAAFGESRDANRHAFGGHLSLQFVLSRAGMARWAWLLIMKGGGERTTIEALEQVAREDPAAWDVLAELLIGRDFPFLAAPKEGPPSGAGETPPPSTSAPSSSSPGSPG